VFLNFFVVRAMLLLLSFYGVGTIHRSEFLFSTISHKEHEVGKEHKAFAVFVFFAHFA